MRAGARERDARRNMMKKEHRDGGQVFPDRKKPCVFHCFGQIFMQDVIGHPDHEKQKNKIA